MNRSFPRASIAPMRKTFGAVCFVLACAAAATAMAQATVNAPAPNIEVADARASSPRISLRALRGKVVVVTFWATWCEPCRAELPFLQRMFSTYQARGLRVLGINNDQQLANMQAFVTRNRLTFPMSHDPGNAVRRLYGINAQSATVIIDKQGRVKHIHTRFTAADGPTIEREIAALL